MWSVGKGIAALTTVGAVGGLGAYLGGAFETKENKPTIVKTSVKETLEKEGFKVLNTDVAGSDWTAVLEEYKKHQIKTFSGSPENNKEEADLRKKCREILVLETSTDYSKAKRWCVKKEKMNTVITSAGYVVLKSKDAVAEGENTKWEQKIKEWKTANPQPFESLKGQIKEETAGSNNVTLFRKECEKLKIDELETTSDEFEANFDLAKKWCSVKAGS